MFCYPEHTDREIERLFDWLRNERYFCDLDARTFATKAAHLLADPNAVHPFRDGNGRSQLVFMSLLAEQAGHPLDFDRLNPPAMMDAMVSSFGGNEQSLAELILQLIH